MEKYKFVDQKLEARFVAIREVILGHPQVFRHQGTVVETWRSYRGNRRGPYYSFRYRLQGRQEAIYLGRSAALAEQVRNLLRDIQEGRQIARLLWQARAELRKQKKSWEQDLAPLGLSLRGFQVQGWRHMEEGDPLPAFRDLPKEGSLCPRTSQ